MESRITVVAEDISQEGLINSLICVSTAINQGTNPASALSPDVRPPPAANQYQQAGNYGQHYYAEPTKYQQLPYAEARYPRQATSPPAHYGAAGYLRGQARLIMCLSTMKQQCMLLTPGSHQLFLFHERRSAGARLQRPGAPTGAVLPTPTGGPPG